MRTSGATIRNGRCLHGLAELAIPYSIVGPDGTRVVIGNSDLAKADPDWIGTLDPDSPLSISRAIRGSTESLVEGDGGVPGPRYHDPASLVMRGTLDRNASIETINDYESRLRRATMALRDGDSVLRYSPTGQQERAWWLRRTADPDISGRHPGKTFQLSFESANPYAASPTELSAVIVPGAAAGELGFASPIVSPLASAIGATGQGDVPNDGDIVTWPRFRIMGPISNPRVVNNSTSQEARFIYTLNAGEWLDIYPAVGRVLLAGSFDRYSAYDRANSRWWQLRRGVNDIRLLATAYSAGASLTLYWRHLWEQ